MSGGKESPGEAFRAGRTGAILRCAKIIADAGRKDLAKQILEVTRVDLAAALKWRDKYGPGA